VLQVDVVVIGVPRRQWPYVDVIVVTVVPLGSRWPSSPFAQVGVIVVIVVASSTTLVVGRPSGGGDRHRRRPGCGSYGRGRPN